MQVFGDPGERAGYLRYLSVSVSKEEAVGGSSTLPSGLKCGVTLGPLTTVYSAYQAFRFPCPTATLARYVRAAIPSPGAMAIAEVNIFVAIPGM